MIISLKWYRLLHSKWYQHLLAKLLDRTLSKGFEPPAAWQITTVFFMVLSAARRRYCFVWHKQFCLSETIRYLSPKLYVINNYGTIKHAFPRSAGMFFPSKFEKRGKRFGGFKEKAYICSGFFISNAPKGVQYDCQRDMTLELISFSRTT